MDSGFLVKKKQQRKPITIISEPFSTSNYFCTAGFVVGKEKCERGWRFTVVSGLERLFVLITY